MGAPLAHGVHYEFRVLPTPAVLQVARTISAEESIWTFPWPGAEKGEEALAGARGAESRRRAFSSLLSRDRKGVWDGSGGPSNWDDSRGSLLVGVGIPARSRLSAGLTQRSAPWPCGPQKVMKSVNRSLAVAAL
jgi:hypothetical protein